MKRLFIAALNFYKGTSSISASIDGIINIQSEDDNLAGGTITITMYALPSEV